MLDNGINISEFMETNSNWNHKQLKKDIKATGSSVFSNSSIAFSYNEFNTPGGSAYLPGGCMQMCTDHWTARIINEIKDPRRMGRWTGHQYRLRDSKTLTVITAYRPCHQSQADNSKACITSSYQQQLLYRKEKGKKIDPRQLFMADLTNPEDREKSRQHGGTDVGR
jgi:hypothetical protein